MKSQGLRLFVAADVLVTSILDDLFVCCLLKLTRAPKEKFTETRPWIMENHTKSSTYCSSLDIMAGGGWTWVQYI